MKLLIAFLSCLLLIGCNGGYMPLNFKFVTSGQAVDDALTVAQTLNGVSMKPFAPVNLRGTRDSANNLFIQWVRRGRIAGGLRANVGTSIAEETERYDLEFYSGSTLKSSYSVSIPPPITPFELDRSSVDSNGSVTLHGYKVVSVQSLGAENAWVEAKVSGISSSKAASVGITDFFKLISGDDGSGGVTWTDGWYLSAYVDTTGGLQVTESTSGGFNQGVAYSSDDAVVRVALRAGRVQVYLNPSGSNDLPLFVSAKTDASGRDIRGRFFGDATGGAFVTKRKILLSDSTQFLYTAVQQTADGFTPGSSITVRIYQVSSIVGRGSYAQATL